MISLIRLVMVSIITGIVLALILWVLGNMFGFNVDFWYSARWLAVGLFILDVALSLVIAIISDDHDSTDRFGRTRWF